MIVHPNKEIDIHYMDKDIFQYLFFCDSQKKERHTGLEGHEVE